MELTPDKHRTMIGFSVQLFFAVGITVVAGLAYLIRDWAMLQIVFGVLSVAMLLHWWYSMTFSKATHRGAKMA